MIGDWLYTMDDLIIMDDVDNIAWIIVDQKLFQLESNFSILYNER